MKGFVLGVLILALVMCLVMLVKNEVTLRHHLRLNSAIYTRHIWHIQHGLPLDVDYDDMESYEKTLFRLWDWGYTRILPPDKFELIKPFL